MPHVPHSPPSAETLTRAAALAAIPCQTHVSLQPGWLQTTTRQPPLRTIQLLESLKTQLFHQAGWRRRNSRRGTDFFQCRGQLCKSGEGSSSSTQCPAVWPDYSKARQGGDGTLQEGSAEKEVKAGRTESCHTFFFKHLLH